MLDVINGKFLKIVPENTENLFKVSVSKYKTFDSCNAKYYFQYELKLPKKEWDHSIFGSFLHEVLERFEFETLLGSSVDDNLLMTKVFKECLKGLPFKVFFGPKDENEKILKGKNSSFDVWEGKLTKHQRKESFDILKDFLLIRKNRKETGKLAQTKEVEKPFNIQIGDNIFLNGFIDLIRIDQDGVLHVCDYKSSATDKYLKKDPLQLKVYAYALFLENPELEVIRTSYIMLRISFKEITFEFTRKEAMECEKHFTKFVDQVKEETLFRATPSPLCSYCDFLDHCQDGKKKVEYFEQRSSKKQDASFGEANW